MQALRCPKGRILGLGLLGLIVAIMAAELLIRASYSLSGNPSLLYLREAQQRIYADLWEAWNRCEESPFLPPFPVYTNTRLSDEGRLKEILARTRLSPANSGSSYDFITPELPHEATRYSVRINSLGFRGKEANSQKARGIRRVIALGSYHTFGHGVGDEAAYPAFLERALNRGAGAKAKWEVWNGGRHAASAVVGLARLRYEIFAYEPDFLILDYGFVDSFIFHDDIMPGMLKFSGPLGRSLAKYLLLPLTPILKRSHLVFRLFQKIGPASATYQEQFRQTLRAMLSLAQEHRVPVILVRQIATPIPLALYQELAQQFPGTKVLDVPQEMYFHPATRTQERDFLQTRNWRDLIDRSAWYTQPLLFSAPYRINFLQLSPAGHALIANALHELLLEDERSALLRPAVKQDRKGRR